MGQKIASLYAEIGADTSKLKKGLGDSKKEMGSFATQMKNQFGGIAGAVGVVTGSLAVMDKMMDFGKAGAQIVYTREKFDRLAESIGTTGDALMSELNVAMDGTRSKLELTAGVTGLLELGLAKTSDEAVRMANVVGQLGMDTNQLVLTLTNQTTMRFDALHVATAGFDERLQALKDTGMDVNDAFTEAFLQQAEEQIKTVGSIADSDVAAFMRFEAATEDLGAALKTSLVPFLTEAAVAGTRILNWSKDYNTVVQKHSKDIALLGGSYEDYIAEMARATKWSEAGLNQMNDNRWNEVYAKRVDAIGLLTRAEFENAAAVQYDAEAFTRRLPQIQDNTIATYEFSDALEEGANNEMAHYLKVAEQGAEIDRQFASAAGDAAVQHYDLASAMMGVSEVQYGQQAIESLQGLLKTGKITSDEFAKMSEAVGLQFGTIDQGAIDAAANFNLVNEAIANGSLADWNVAEAFELARTSGDQFLDIVENRFPGVMTAAAESAIENGGLMEEGFAPANVKTAAILGDLKEIDGMSVHAAIHISTSKSVPSIGGGGYSGPNTSIKDEREERGFATGASNFVIPPGYPNDSYKAGFTSGEVLNVTSRKEVNSGGGNNGAVVAAIKEMSRKLDEIPRKWAQESARLPH